jgi:prephenate dehydrogenase
MTPEVVILGIGLISGIIGLYVKMVAKEKEHEMRILSLEKWREQYEEKIDKKLDAIMDAITELKIKIG